jgi:hypothetical protein
MADASAAFHINIPARAAPIFTDDKLDFVVE